MTLPYNTCSEPPDKLQFYRMWQWDQHGKDAKLGFGKSAKMTNGIPMITLL